MHADCEREPITFPERIQSFGFLLAVTNNWVIERASANLSQFLGMEAKSAIGMLLDRVIPQPAMHHLRYRVAMPGAGRGIDRIFGLRLRPGGDLYDLAFHLSGSLLIIEGEPCGSDQPASAATLVRSMMGQVQSQATVDSLYIDAARQVRAITGFDRALIYRIDEDGTGQVIAESAKADVDPLLGLHFPATDIPSQAQSLYLRNPFRIIANVAAAPVALVSSGSGRTAPPPPLDLTLAVTRAVSPVHIEYLRNMGVAASLSISIIVDNTLWGLFACHHFTPRLPSFVMRSAAELFGAMFSLTLENRLHASAAADDTRNRIAIEEIASAASADPTRLADPVWLSTTIAKVIDCDGIALTNNGALTTAGTVPDKAAIMTLVESLDRADIDRVCATDCLGHSERAAGVLAIPIARSPRDYLLLFRQARVGEKRWGGDPDPVVVVDIGEPPTAASLPHPRTSFSPFVRGNLGQSSSFTDGDCRAAEMIRTAFDRILLKLLVTKTNHAEQGSARQDMVIAELNHRVRNILTLIRGLIGQTAIDGIGTEDYVAALGGRVQALARAHDHATRGDGVSGTLIALLDDEIAAFVPTRRDRFQMFGPVVRFDAQALATLALVIHELVTNSVKHGAFSTSGTVELHITNDTDGVRMAWRERQGPTPSEPRERGFGSVIIERMIPFDLQGLARTRYPPAGFEADFFVPAAHVVAEAELLVAIPIGTASSDAPSDRPLAGLSVLLLEDNMIVALEAEDLLHQLGAAKVEIAADLIGAEKAIDRGGVDIVMLDIGIGDLNSAPLARRLSSVSIAFFFASGYDERPGLASEFADIPIVGKPYSLTNLRMAATQSLMR